MSESGPASPRPQEPNRRTSAPVMAWWITAAIAGRIGGIRQELLNPALVQGAGDQPKGAALDLGSVGG